ncbi:MAG: ABC transporter ATP-binding protein [Candidatus Nanopelagicales bacterium]
MTVVRIHGIDASYGSHVVLHDLSLDIASGSLTAVLGASGSGKTTLLRALAGFIRPTSGEIYFGDRLVVGPHTWVPPEKRRVGIVPQEGALFPHLSVAGNIAFGLARDEDRKQRVDYLLDLVGLAGLADARPMELSGGQQQRVALARALAPEPDVVLLDEPFTALDANLRGRLRAEVREVLAHVGTTAVLVTHDQEEALSTADAVAVMRGGRVVQVAAPRDLYLAPADLSVARFVGDVVELAVLAEAPGNQVNTSIGWLRTDPDTRASLNGTDVVVIRPEQLSLTDPTGDDTAALVIAREFHGHDSMITLELEGGATLPIRVAGAQTPETGTKVGVRVDGDARRFR